jgi:hypothetical protein
LTGLPLPPPHQINSRLELVHRVQDQLKSKLVLDWTFGHGGLQ